MTAGPILVTGASGFIGSHLVRRLVSSGAAVTGLCAAPGPAPRFDGLPPSFTMARGDLRDPVTVERLFAGTPFRTVFHLAAQGVRQEDDGGLATVEVNTLAAFPLARSARNFGVDRFIYCGSGFEYSPASTPLSESAPLGASTLYGASKAAGWLLLDYLRRMEGLPLVTVRPFTVFGPGEAGTKLIPYVILNALRRRPLQLTAGTQVRDYVYISDVVKALTLAAEKAEPGDVFNIGSGPAGARTIRSIVEAILELTGAEPSLCSFGDADRARFDPPFLVSDPSLACTKLGWTPQVAFEAGLRQTVEWYKKTLLPPPL